MTRHTLLRASALGLALGPLLFTFGDLLRRLVEPSSSPSAVEITRAVGDHSTAWLWAGALSMLAAPLILIGLVGLLVDASGRGGRTTIVGGVLVAVGLCASVGHSVAFYTPYAVYERAGTPDAALRAQEAASESYPLLASLIGLFIVGMMLGSIVLFVGLRRARRVPVWSVISAVVFVAAGSSGGVAAGAVGVVAAAFAFGMAAWSLARCRSKAPAGLEKTVANLPL